MAGLILIASYPKSGNTWVRMVLQGLMEPSRAGDLSSLRIGIYGRNKRELFDEFSPADAADLEWSEIQLLTPWVNAGLAATYPGPVVIKTHELLEKNRDGAWPYRVEDVVAVLNIIRHPYDVAASFANHLGKSITQSVENMCADFWLGQSRVKGDVLPEHIGSWSANIASWTATKLPYTAVTVRYEDLLEDDLGCFDKLMSHTGLPYSPADLRAVVEATRFAKLHSQESIRGFREKPAVSSQFFRSGKVRSWGGLLTSEDRAALMRAHGEMMTKWGYNDDGSASPYISS